VVRYLAHLRGAWCTFTNALRAADCRIVEGPPRAGWRERLEWRAKEVRRVTAGALAEYADAFGDDAATHAWAAITGAIRPTAARLDLPAPPSAVPLFDTSAPHDRGADQVSRAATPTPGLTLPLFSPDAMTPAHDVAPTTVPHPTELADAVRELGAQIAAARARPTVTVTDAWIRREAEDIAGTFRTGVADVRAFADNMIAELRRQEIATTPATQHPDATDSPRPHVRPRIG
jgi:hypothetical protein